MAELRHPFIAEIYGFGERQGIAFIVLEHCPGGTLRAQLSDSNVTPRQHLSILSCVASALEAAHAKAVIPP
jgi:serine/threonine protein kinase